MKNERCSSKLKCEFEKGGERDLTLLALEVQWEQSQATSESSWKSHYVCPFYYLYPLYISYSANLIAVDKNYFLFYADPLI